METQRNILMITLVVQIASLMLSTQVYGQTKKTEPAISETIETTNKVEIKKDELPEAAKKILTGNEVKDWVIGKTYRVKTKVRDASGKEIEEYEVEVKKDNQMQVLLFDKDGNIKTI